MSSVPNVIEFPVRRADHAGGSLEHELLLALATAADLESGMEQAVELIHRGSGASRVEWWATGDDGALELRAVLGIARGRRQELPAGGAGAFVLHGGKVGPEILSALMTAASIIRRRAAEERLAQIAVDLTRRNEALEDFAALVAHELKTPLRAALLADDPSSHVEDALNLVDELLEVARSEPIQRVFVSAAESLDQALEDVGADVEVTADLQATLPLPTRTLRVILRNLLANAVAAGAHHVHVAAIESPRSWRLCVDDDGVGLTGDQYATGSGLGLSLLGGIAGRFGGVLELASQPSGGTRAILEFQEVAP
jgi:signal transduction histidine kinase